jgi:hypothetical protein
MKIEDLDQVVGVHVGNPLLQLRPEFSPRGNVVGVLLLWRMLELALLDDGLTREDCCVYQGADFNDCTFLAAVTDCVAAVERVKRELELVVVLLHCQIGVMESTGWRCVYPSPEIRLTWLMDAERLDLATEKFLQAQSQQFDLVRKVLHEIQRNKGEQGGKS